MNDEAFDLITPAEAGTLLGIDTEMVMRLRREKKLEGIKYAHKTILFERRIVLAFREACRDKFREAARG